MILCNAIAGKVGTNMHRPPGIDSEQCADIQLTKGIHTDTLSVFRDIDRALLTFESARTSRRLWNALDERLTLLYTDRLGMLPTSMRKNGYSGQKLLSTYCNTV